jgi:hypothetical protein
MRLYCKLVLMLAITWGAQTWVQRNMDELDEAQFTLRVMYSEIIPGDTQEQLDAAADRLTQRRVDRFLKELSDHERQALQTCAAAAS